MLQEGSVQGTCGACGDACSVCQGGSTSWRGGVQCEQCVRAQAVRVQGMQGCASSTWLCKAAQRAGGVCRGHTGSMGVRPVPLWGRAAPYL